MDKKINRVGKDIKRAETALHKADKDKSTLLKADKKQDKKLNKLEKGAKR